MKTVGLPRLIVAGTASGVGKTTIASGLMAALVAQGMAVQGFKVGPDYIDPTYHRAATGRPSYNLDTWLSGPDAVRRRFEVSMTGADVAIIEGVMGLFDGRTGTRDTASTAEVARLLDVPVVLVVDVARMGQSAAAVVAGFQRLDPRVRVVGVILNRLASANHEATVRLAISEWTGLPVLGAIRRDERLVLPERHLGLVPAPEAAVTARVLGEAIASFLDMPALLARLQQVGPLPPAEAANALPKPVPLAYEVTPPLRLGLALDDAFSFYYPETLEALETLGVEVVPFSPLADAALPAPLDLLYFGGGFPEVFAERLAENQPMLSSVREAARRNVPIYAECGGLMYLGESCLDADGHRHMLVGALPLTTQVGKRRAQLGYREVTLARDTLLGPEGTRLRGHEFHWSSLVQPVPSASAAYRLEGPEERLEGYANETLLASYIHIPLAAYPKSLSWLISHCIEYRRAAGASGKGGAL